MADMEVHASTRINKNGRIKLFDTYPEMRALIKDQISSQLRIILENEQFPNRKRKRVSDDKNDDIHKTKNINENVTASSVQGLVKVNIRLRENNISVVDEFRVDPNHPKSNPLFLAESIVTDLKLPQSMINSIAISIAEQICGLHVNENVEGMLKYDSAVKSRTIASNESPLKKMQVDKRVPTAWPLDEKEQKMSDDHFLSLSKPHKQSSKKKSDKKKSDKKKSDKKKSDKKRSDKKRSDKKQSDKEQSDKKQSDKKQNDQKQ
eukprot:845420_1